VHLISQILVETGHIGRQASASVMVTDGETVSRYNFINKWHVQRGSLFEHFVGVLRSMSQSRTSGRTQFFQNLSSRGRLPVIHFPTKGATFEHFSNSFRT
jgi:hypothetical protein